MAASLLDAAGLAQRCAEQLSAGLDAIVAHVSQAVREERAARAVREGGRPDLAEKILVSAERELHRHLAVVFDDLPMVRHNGRRPARASAFDLLTDAALSAVDFAEGAAPGVTAMMALTGEALAAEQCAAAIRAAGYDAFADEVICRADVILDAGMESIFRGLPTFRYDGQRTDAAAAEPRRPQRRGAISARRAAQRHRSRSR